MRRWAYEIHSTFTVKEAPLDIKLEEAIIDTIENTLKVSTSYAFQKNYYFILMRYISFVLFGLRITKW